MIYKRKTTMNLRKNITYLFFSFLSLLAVTACSDEDDAVIAGGKESAVTSVAKDTCLKTIWQMLKR